MSNESASAIRVFISYSWDSEAHKQRVLKLAQRLREDGVDAWLDSFTPFPEEGWQRWMENEIGNAKFVVVIATDKYEQRFAGKGPKGVGLGVNWEGAIITTELYDSRGRNEKFLPAFFSKESETHIPMPLRPYTRFNVSEDTGYTDLYRLVTGQPKVTPAPLGKKRNLSAGIKDTTLPALDIPPIHEHAAAHSNLPRLPYGFFGREDELRKIADALAPSARTWGALIDGPGGIGKTALAVRSAELTLPGQFERIIFLSAKLQELTPEGAKKLTNFIVPAYLDMLNELARQIDQSELTKVDEKERPALVQRALQSHRALLIFDNLESLSVDDRNSVFEFLGRLPSACKAIVTSRRRSDTDARVIRLERLSQEAAIHFIAKLAEDRPLLSNASEAERIALYTGTGGSPLLIRWVAGQLGRGGCRTVGAALKLLASAPAGNDPLEFIFGDLVDTFTDDETKALAALTHFSLPTEVKFVAELSELAQVAAQTALEDLGNRALVTGDSESRVFNMMPLVANFLRRARPEVVRSTGNRLSDVAYALSVENGYSNYDRFPALESAWPQIAAAIPLFLQGENRQLQTVCDALSDFLDFSGRWDERLLLNLRAEEKAVAAKDFYNAGWRAYQAGWVYRLREQSQDVLDCSARCASHWREAGTKERAQAVRLRGKGYDLAKNYSQAILAYQEALELLRSIDPESEDVVLLLNDIAGGKRKDQKLVDAEGSFNEALRIATDRGFSHTAAILNANLALLFLDRNEAHRAEGYAREALALSETISRKELIAGSLDFLATSLLRQGRNLEALPYAQRAVTLLSDLRSPRLGAAEKTLRECQTKDS